MKNAKVEMRIEKEKKEQLAQVASEMGLKVSDVLNVLVEEFLNDHCIVEEGVNRNCKIVTRLMSINDLACQVEGDLHDPLLKELGELECLL